MIRGDTPAAPLMRAGAALGGLAVLDAVLWSVQCAAGAWPRGWALALDGLIFGSFLVIPLLLGLRAWREGPAALGQRLARRSDSEHAQAAVRIALGSMALAHMTVLHRTDPSPAFGDAVYVAGIGVALSWLLLLDVVRRPQPLRWRRIAANVLDIANLSMFLHLGGPETAVWYPVYLWVTFGNGLRYDVRSLAISCAMSVAGFGAVIATTPYWSNQPILSAGLLIALIVLPAYIASLIRSVMAAKAQAEAANEAKSRFLAMMSHEVRTPLNSVMGFSSMLARTELGPPQREMLEMVRLSADNLLSLINDILDLAKIESGRPLAQVQDFDLWETVRTATRLLHPQAREKGLMVSVRIDARTPRHVHGMAAALRQVVVNLVGNAVKFTEAGRIDVAVSPVLSTGDGGDLRAGVQIVIEDQGIGIPPDMLERIFEPFTQGDDSITRQYQGSGLGLAIVRSLVEGMGGRVWVESARGVGSRFSLTVPLVQRGVPDDAPDVPLSAPVRIIGDDQAAAARLHGLLVEAGLNSRRDGDPEDASPAEPVLAVAHGVGADGLPEALGICSGRDWKPDQGWVATAELNRPYGAGELRQAALAMLAAAAGGEPRPAPAPALAPLTILIADDNETNRLMLGRLLGQEGHSVLFARDGEEALDAVESSPLDAVIMDINMPRMSGLEATRLLRYMHSGERHLPVIALTADATPATARRCREAGMDDLITKPVDRIRLLASLARLCEPDPERRVPSVAAAPAPAPEDDAADALPVLEAGMAATLTEEPDFLDRLYGAFAEDSQRAIADMRRSLAEGDAGLLRDAAHSLRSAASNLGGLRLVAAAGPLKTWGNAELVQSGPAAVQRIEEERARLLEALAALGPAPVP